MSKLNVYVIHLLTKTMEGNVYLLVTNVVFGNKIVEIFCSGRARPLLTTCIE